MRDEIIISGNTIGGRQGFAYVCNSMKYPVLIADIDKHQGENGYCRFDTVRVVWNHRGKEMPVEGTLEVEDGKWSIGNGGCCLSASFTYSDMVESITNANAPVIREGQVIAVALKSDKAKHCWLMMFKVGKLDIHCTTMCELIDLTDDEMKEVVADAKRWLS